MVGRRMNMTTVDAVQMRGWVHQIQKRQAVFIDQQPSGITRWLVPDGSRNLVAEYDGAARAIVGVLDEAWAVYFQRARRREAARMRKLRELIEEYVDGAARDGRQHAGTAVLRIGVEEALKHYGEACRHEVWRERQFGQELTPVTILIDKD